MGKDIIPQDKPSKLRKQAEKNLEIRLKDPKEKLCFQRALRHPRWTHSNNPGHGRAHHPSQRGHRQFNGRQ